VGPALLVTVLLSGGPRKSKDAYMALSSLVYAGTDLAPFLEKVTSKDWKRSYWIGDLVGDSHHRQQRHERWAKWLKQIDNDKVTSAQFLGLGNSSADERRYLPYALAYLADPKTSAEVRESVVYFLTFLGRRYPDALDERARAAMESGAPPRAKSKSSRKASSPKSAKPNAAVTAAIARLEDPRATARQKGVRELLELLSGDMVDIRSAFPALAKALSDTNLRVRRTAALTAYYAFDLQRGIRELSVLVVPTKRALRDADAEVRKHARTAYEAYERAKR
jgi:hypothetical protein